jgi:ribonuclease Y
MSVIVTIIIALFTLMLGAILATTVLRKIVDKKSQKILIEAEEKAEVIKKEKILQAKEKFLQLKAEHEKVIQEKNNNILKAENRIKQKETALSQKYEEVQRKQNELNALKENLNSQLEIVNKKQAELEKIHKSQVEKLELIAGLTAKEAKEQLIDTLKEEAKNDAMNLIKDVMDEAKITANIEAKKIVIQ